MAARRSPMRYRRGFRLCGATAASVGRAVGDAIGSLRRASRNTGEDAPDHLVSGYLEAAVMAAIWGGGGETADGRRPDTLVRAARHRLGGSFLDQDRLSFRTRPRRCALVLWRKARSSAARCRVEAVAVLYAARFRKGDWTPDFDSSGADPPGWLALTHGGRRRLAWACVLPGREGDVARLYPECGLRARRVARRRGRGVAARMQCGPCPACGDPHYVDGCARCGRVHGPAGPRPG